MDKKVELKERTKNLKERKHYSHIVMAKESSAYLGKGGLSMYYCIYVLVHRAFVVLYK